MIPEFAKSLVMFQLKKMVILWAFPLFRITNT